MSTTPRRPRPVNHKIKARPARPLAIGRNTYRTSPVTPRPAR